MAGPLANSLRGLWVSGLLPSCNGGPSQGRRPENRPGGDDSDPWAGIPKRKLPNCQRQKGTPRVSVGYINTAKGRDPRTQTSWRHWLRRVVAATADMIRLDGRGRLPFRARRGQLYQVLRDRRFCLSAADCWASMLWGTGREAQRRLNFGAVCIFAVSTATSSLLVHVKMLLAGIIGHFLTWRSTWLVQSDWKA